MNNKRTRESEAEVKQNVSAVLEGYQSRPDNFSFCEHTQYSGTQHINKKSLRANPPTHLLDLRILSNVDKGSVPNFAGLTNSLTKYSTQCMAPDAQVCSAWSVVGSLVDLEVNRKAMRTLVAIAFIACPKFILMAGQQAHFATKQRLNSASISMECSLTNNICHSFFFFFPLSTAFDEYLLHARLG